MDNRRYRRWVCPRCETVNTGNFCPVCGQRVIGVETDVRSRPRDLLPEDRVLAQAHKMAVVRVRQTVPFFILTAVLCWVIGFLFGCVCAVIIPLLGLFAGGLYNLFLGNVFEYGEHVAGLRLYRDKDISVGTLFEGMNDYGRILGGMFWFKLRRGLWMLVPVAGIMKHYSYLFTPYILYERPNLSAEEAMQESARLTEGHKMELFVRDLKLTGWRLLSGVTLNIVGVLYYFAYNDAIWAGFYDAARDRTVNAGTEETGESFRREIVREREAENTTGPFGIPGPL